MRKQGRVLLLSIFFLMLLLFTGCSKGAEGTKDKEGKPASGTEGKNTAAGTSSEEVPEDSSGKAVVFEDPLFERYIRSYLGKATEDKIFAEELSEMTELVIDRRFIETEWSYMLKKVTLMRMDLSDLKYFTNLKKLQIQNSMDDILYSLDAIALCTKLEELSLAYGTTGGLVIQPTNQYVTAYGYKTLYGILDQLPDLKKLELGNTNTVIRDDIQKKYPRIAITTDRAVQVISLFSQYPGLITKVSELDVLPADTTIINMELMEGEDTSAAIQRAAEFDKLTVLRIAVSEGANYDLAPLENHEALAELALYRNTSLTADIETIQNEQVLTSLPKLRYLSLSSLALSDEVLASLKQLKTLSLFQAEIDGFRFLSSCTELYQLKLFGGSSSREDEDELLEEFIRGMESQRNLQYLSTEMTGPILSYCPEVVMQMTRLKDFTSIEANEGDYYNRLNLSGCKDLKRVVLSSKNELKKYDLSSLQGLNKLEYLWLVGSNQYDHAEILSELVNLKYIQVKLQSLENDLLQLEEMSQALVELPEISSVIFHHPRIVDQIPLPEDLKKVFERLSEQLYEEGIFEIYYGLSTWR